MALCSPVWLHTRFLHSYLLDHAACAPAVAACTLVLALCAPRAATHSFPPSYSSVPGCKGASCGCRQAWLGFVYALYGYTFSASTCIFLSRAACTLGLAFRAPCMGSHSIPPSAASEPSCTCADCGCMHACLGSVYSLHGYTPSSSICIFCAELHVRQLWLHARLVCLCVCPAWLCTQFHHLYFLSRPACAPAAGMHAWPGFVYALYGRTFNSSSCIFRA